MINEPVLIKWPSIQQLRHVIDAVTFRAQFTGKLDDQNAPILDLSKKAPTLKYRAVVKIHGTNSSVVSNIENGLRWSQSREQILQGDVDNAHFNEWASSKAKGFFDQLTKDISKHIPSGHKIIAIFGEWAGLGVQKSAAVGKLPPFFTIFGACSLNEEGLEDFNKRYWLSEDLLQSLVAQIKQIENLTNVYHTLDFPVYYQTLDFSNPDSFIEPLTKLVLQIEQECPVGAQLGVKGIGEGLVFSCITPGWESVRHRFKLKGDKHKVSKTKTTVQLAPEVQESIDAFVEYSCTEARLSQGIDVSIVQAQKKFVLDNVGDFIKWAITDIFKEEADVIQASALDKKLLSKALSRKLRDWFVERMQPY